MTVVMTKGIGVVEPAARAVAGAASAAITVMRTTRKTMTVHGEEVAVMIIMARGEDAVTTSIKYEFYSFTK